MQKQRNLILITSVIILAAAFFIYRDLKVNKEGGATNTEQPTGNIDVSLPGATQVKNAAIQQSDKAPVVTMPMPDLNRALVFTVPFPDSEQAKIRAQAADLAGVLKKNPDLFNDWLMLGLLRKTIGDYEGAEQVWEYASAIRPKNYVSFSNLGDLYHYYLKDYPKAEQNLKQAIKNEPSNIGLYRSLVDLYTQSYTEKLGEVPAVLTGGLKANPEQYDLLIMMASYYQNAGDKVNAKAYYERALTAADKLGMTDMKKVISGEIQKLSQ